MYHLMLWGPNDFVLISRGIEPPDEVRPEHLLLLYVGVREQMEGGGGEAAAMYPQLSMAVVSLKTQKTKPGHQRRERSEGAHSRSKAPVESQRREEQASSAKNDGDGGGSREKREGTSDDGDKSNGKLIGMVGNPYHPAERGVGRGGIDGLVVDQQRLPKPHKFQEVR